MRKLHLFERVSADGYFSDDQGGLEWPVQDEDLDRDATEGMPAADAMLFGRTTYDGFKRFWPGAAGESPHGPARQTGALKAMATWINASTKYVLSRTLKDTSWSGTQLLGEFTPEKIEALKAGPGKDIMVFGSGAIASLLAAHGLVDDYTFVVSPILLGRGGRAIRELTHDVKLELVDCTRFKTGNVRLRYAKA